MTLTKKALMMLTILSNIAYLTWRILFSLPLGYGYLSLTFGLVLWIAETIGFFENAALFVTIAHDQETNIPKVSTEDWPSVDVFIATYNEPIDLVYKTLIAAQHLNYPNQKILNIYLCDDKRREDMKALAFKLGIHYITRPNNLHAKAGNLNNALNFSKGDLILTLDADMIVHPDFLMKTVPFFIEDSKMGFVQTPHRFYNVDTFQYNMFAEERIPNEQDLFHTLIQNGRAQHNAVIYAGSNTVISRAALVETGGFETGTITEDIATGMKLQAKGFHSTFVNETLAMGLAPFNISDVITQRIRWAVGTLQTFGKRSGYFSKLNFTQKLIYASSISYWFSSFRRWIYLAAPLLFILLNIRVVIADLNGILLFWLPMFIFNHLAFHVLSSGVRSTLLSNLYETIFAPALSFNILKELLGFKLTQFKVTPKELTQQHRFIFNLRFFKTHLILFVLNMIALGLSAYYFYTSEFSFIYGINLFWITYNAYLLALSLLYAIERPIYRETVRFKLKLPVILTIDEVEFKLETHDVSDTGLSIQSPLTLSLDPNKIYTVNLNTVSLKLKLTRTLFSSSQHLYAFKLVDNTDYATQTYLQTIYQTLIESADLHQDLQGKLRLISILKSRFLKPKKAHSLVYIEKALDMFIAGKTESVDVLNLNQDLLSIRYKSKKAPERIKLNMIEHSIHFNLKSKEKSKLIYQVDPVDHPLIPYFIAYLESI